MLDRLVILPKAARDIEDAVEWYEGRDPGLGDVFLQRLDACFVAIRRTPDAFPSVGKNYRRALVQRFPYGVFYESVNDSIVVYAVIHCSQDPDKWRRRLP